VSDENLEQIKIDFGSVFKLRRIDDTPKNNYFPVIISKDEYEKVAESEYVKELIFYRYVHHIPTGRDSYVNIGTDEEPEYIRQNRDISGLRVNNSEYISLSDNPFYERIYIVGYNIELPIPLELFDGRMIENDGECVITREFLRDFTNKDDTFFQDRGIELKIGDELTLIEKISYFETEDDEEVKIKEVEKTFKIVGIVENPPEEYLHGDSRIIYTTMDDSYYWHGGNRKLTYDVTTGFEALYYLHSYKDGEKFLEEVNIDLRYGDFVAEYNQSGFEKLLSPLEKLQTSCVLFILIELGVSMCIIIIMTLLSLSDRKYDIGVLCSIGMSKAKIMFSFILEISAFILCLILAGLIAGFIISESSAFDNILIMFNVSIRIILAGIGLTIISSLISFLFILKYQPMKILRNR